MRKNRTILALGIFIALMPFYIGLPLFWKNILYVVLGVAIALLSLMAEKERPPARASKPKAPSMNDVFVENKTRRVVKKEKIILP